MAKIVCEKSHDKSPEDARKALESFEADMSKYGMKAAWKGNNATLKGTGASGEIKVDSGKVVVEIKLGMLAKAAGIDADKLKGSIQKRLDKALG